MKRAESIHQHPAEVAEVIREAEENEDIPTKTAVAVGRRPSRNAFSRPNDDGSGRCSRTPKCDNGPFPQLT